MSIEDTWYGETITAKSARAALAPLSWLYGAAVAARNSMYDTHMLRSVRSAVPVISVGNVTVGGTGKTPFTAFIVAELIAGGHRPAVVMRGYGDDEPKLHARMNPSAPVYVNADRVAGIEEAVSAGADVVVLDDGFQHRRAARDLDIVLVSAERWLERARVLPAGPLREGVVALRRADLVVVTRKSAGDATAREVAASVQLIAGREKPIAIASLEPTALVAATGTESLPLSALSGARVLAVAGVGDPASFFEQLRALGASVTTRRFRDHHAYTSRDATELAADAVSHKYVVTTEKDAVKLALKWPANGPELWYLSQAVRLSVGTTAVAAALVNSFKRATSIVG